MSVRSNEWPSLTGTDLSGMTKTKRVAMSSTCAIMESNPRKPKNVSSMTTCLPRITDDFDDVNVLDGKTDRGRRLRLIFQDKGDGLARIFIGWELKKTTKRKR